MPQKLSAKVKDVKDVKDKPKLAKKSKVISQPMDYKNAFPTILTLTDKTSEGCEKCSAKDFTHSHVFLPLDQISDGYHTFGELYEHRCLLFLGLAALADKRTEPYSCAWKSRKHHDDSSLDGWFIAGVSLPTGDVTYRLPDRLWDIARLPERSNAPEWDGHDSREVLNRLANWLAI